MHQRKKAAKTLMHLSPGRLLQSLGKLTPLFFGTLKGLGLNNSYSNTYDLWNISQISTEQTNKKVGYNHQVIDILATQDTV